MKNPVIVIFCLLLPMFISCSSTKPVNKTTIISNTQWYLSTLNGAVPDTKSPDLQTPYIVFSAAGVFSGHTGCNTFSGKYKYENNMLTLDPGSITKMYCGDSVEMEFLNAIKKVTNFDVKNNNLILLFDGKEVMRFISKK